MRNNTHNRHDGNSNSKNNSGKNNSDSRHTTQNSGNTVIGPGGRRLSIADLPPPNTSRWVMRRKAEVVAAVRGGLLSVAEACKRYNLSEEEYYSWQNLVEKHGIRGLRTTRLGQYRQTTPSSPPASRK